MALVSSLEGLWQLDSGWRKLEQSGLGGHGVFQTFDWVMSWARSYCGRDGVYEPCIVAGYRGEELVFVWPLMLEKRGPMRVLRWLTEPLAQYGDMLVAPGESAEGWGRDGLVLLRRLRHIDVIRLRHVRADAVARPFVERMFRDARHVDHAPWLDLTQFADASTYDRRYSPAQRKRRKKIRKALEDKFGPISFTMLPPGACADAAMAQAVAEKCAWLDERGRHNGVLCKDQMTGFLQDLSRRSGGSGQLVVSRMSAGDQVLSWEIGLRFGKRHFGFVTAHVNALTDYSPARLHMDLSQRQALADGMTSFDLMVPNDVHKESWASGTVETRDYHLPLTAMGTAFGWIYLEGLRPAIRRAYYRLPSRLLRLLKPIIGH